MNKSNTTNNKPSFRHAQRNDVPLILKFIKDLADYEGLLDEVVADEATLEEWIFNRKKAEVIFAMEGDIILAEPKALIGFAGPRVIEQTIRQRLPKGFQRAEFVLDTGFLDAIVDRREQRSYLGKMLKLHCEEADI